MPIYIKFDGIKGDVTAAGALGGGPHVKVFSGSTGSSLLPADAVEISRISLSSAGAGIDGRDPAASVKVGQLVDTVRRQGPSGKLYIATEAGVWRSGGTSRPYHQNNLRQLGLAALNTTVEIYITSANGAVTDKHRLERATVSRHPGGVNVSLGDGSVRF